MDIFDEEILKFWQALKDQNVRYIMVGGYATNLHGYQRYTGDMDIWIDDTIENRMVSMKGLEDCSFDECLQMASIADIDGVLVPFLHINQLITNKKAVNLPKDQLDVMGLERIKNIQSEF